MKKFKFSLQKVLNYKKLIKDQLEINLSKTRQKYELEKQKMEELQEIIDKRQRTFYSGSLNSARLMHNAAALDMLHKGLKNQEKEVNAARENVEKCREKLVAAMKEYEMLEKLKGKRRLEYEKELAAEYQKELDEIAVSAYSRGN